MQAIWSFTGDHLSYRNLITGDGMEVGDTNGFNRSELLDFMFEQGGGGFWVAVRDGRVWAFMQAAVADHPLIPAEVRV